MEDGSSATDHLELQGPGAARIVALQLPPLSEDWVRVRFAYCGLCGTDVAYYQGLRTGLYPRSLGHEWVAVVEEVGSPRSVFKQGDLVTSDLNFRCGTCTQCDEGRSHLCEVGQVGYFSNRGFAQRADIHSTYLELCGPPLGPHLALAEPLSCALHALDRVSVEAGDRVLVVGAGGMGLCIVFSLTFAELPVAFDVTDLRPARLNRLRPLLPVAGSAVNMPTAIYDVVIDVSGTPSGLITACDLVRPGGRLCMLSHLSPNGADGILPEKLLHKDVIFTLTYLNGQRRNLQRAVRMLESNWDSRWDALLDVQPFALVVNALKYRPISDANKIIIDLAQLPG